MDGATTGNTDGPATLTAVGPSPVPGTVEEHERRTPRAVPRGWVAETR
jgi:hypothetical protein